MMCVNMLTFVFVQVNSSGIRSTPIKDKIIGLILKKIRIYSYDKIYVVVKSSSFPCYVSSVSGIKT